MSKISSTIKSNKIISRNRHSNKKHKLAIKTAIKKYLFSIKNYQLEKEDADICLANLSLAYKRIDKAIKRKVLHRNTGARKKAKLAKIIAINQIN